EEERVESSAVSGCAELARDAVRSNAGESDEEIPELAPTTAAGEPEKNGREPIAPESRGGHDVVSLAMLLERMAKLPPRPPLARVEGLRGKYWVTEFSHLGDGARLADLR